MKNKKRRWMLSIGSVLSVSSVAVGIISCGVNPNKGITPTGKNAYEIHFKDGTSKKVTYDEFMDYIRNHQGTNTTQQIQYDNQVIKWLYKDEQYASVIAHEKDDTIPALTSYDDVYKNATKTLDDAKKAIKTQYGTAWEPEWAKALLSEQYGGAFSEESAKEYLAVQTMKADALKRFTLKIDTSTYKAEDIDSLQFPFLVSTGKGANALADNTSKNAIALITSSYDDSYKSPNNLLQTYMSTLHDTNKGQQPAFNIRHVLYAIKAGATTKDPWTLDIKSIGKLYGKLPNQDPPKIIYQQLKELGTNSDSWGVQPDPTQSASSLVGQIVGGYSDNEAAAKTYGSLGMTSLYDDVKNLVPGFAIPIAVSNSSTLGIPQITKTPLNFDLDKALIAGDNTNTWDSTKLPSIDPKIQTDITNILGNAENLKKTMNDLKDQLSVTGKNGTRSLEYAINDGIGTSGTPAVFSADGLHMIYQEKLPYNSDPTYLDGGLGEWTMNDLLNTRDGNPVIYDVLKEVNSKMAPSDNYADIYDIVKNESKPSYSGAEKFDAFVQTQKNYANTDNSKFTSKNIDQAREIATMLKDNTRNTDIMTLQKKYLEWWNKTVITDPLVDPGPLKFSDISNMISKLGEFK